MQTRRLVAFVGAVAVLLIGVPGAVAQDNVVHVKVVVTPATMTIGGGSTKTLDVAVTVTWQAACPSGSQVGVDLVGITADKNWTGANANPFGQQYTYPNQTKHAVLSVTVDEGAPEGQAATYTIQPTTKGPDPPCTTEPSFDAPASHFTIKAGPTPASASSATSAPVTPLDKSGGTPGFGFVALVASLVGVGLLFGRRVHR